MLEFASFCLCLGMLPVLGYWLCWIGELRWHQKRAEYRARAARISRALEG